MRGKKEQHGLMQLWKRKGGGGGLAIGIRNWETVRDSVEARACQYTFLQ